jgi:hypothetical protein
MASASFGETSGDSPGAGAVSAAVDGFAPSAAGSVTGAGEGWAACARRAGNPFPVPPTASPDRKGSAGRIPATAPDTKLMNAKIASTRNFILTPSCRLSLPRRVSPGIGSSWNSPRHRSGLLG